MDYGWGQNQNDDETSVLLPNISDFISEYTSPSVANVEFLNLHENQCFEKVQCRRGGVPRQVVENGVLQMRATYGPEQLVFIRGWLRREPEAARLCNDRNNDVLLCDTAGNEINLVGHNNKIVPVEGGFFSLEFSFDIGKVYEGPSQPIFLLARTDTNVRNRFQLLVQLEFLGQELSESFVSPIFICRTKPNKDRLKRPVSQPDIVDVESPPPSRPRFSPGVESPPWAPLSVESPPLPVSQRNLIVDSLTARTAQIDDLVATRFNTTNADIAYHLKIKDEDLGAELDEGDIVGFFTDPDNGGTYIKRLNNDDIDKAVHAGVVSRSYYIAANKPAEYESATDTVCVIGIVNVKVVGSVENGERIYASIDRPGTAIPQSHLPVGSFLRKRHVLLGMAMERKFPKSLQDAHLVKCFVCIVLDVSRKEIMEEVENLYEITENSTRDQIKQAARKAWRKLICCFAFAFVFIGLLAFLLYQVFVPGSMFRYWLCRKGSISCCSVEFRFFPTRNPHVQYHANGIQFSFNKLKEKVSDDFFRNNKTGGVAFYYLNLDRCAYSGDYGPVGNWIGGHKLIGGGKILSINSGCTKVYYFGFSDGAALGWHAYLSASNLTCHPHAPIK